jgi:hypothetical protein
VRAGWVGVGGSGRARSQLAGGQRLTGATRSYASIWEEVERLLTQAAEADAADDARLGEARGDELPGGLVDARSRREQPPRCTQQLEQAQPSGG